MFSALSIAPGTSYLGWWTNCQTIIKRYLILLITNVNCSFVGKKMVLIIWLGLVLSFWFDLVLWFGWVGYVVRGKSLELKLTKGALTDTKPNWPPELLRSGPD